MVLSEFAIGDWPEGLASKSWILSPPLAGFGLFLMSMPTDFVHQAKWSSLLQVLGAKWFPAESEVAREWASIGALILLFAIIISPHLRILLSRPPLIWLGKVSFPIYLLHGIFMRTMLAWFVFAGQIPIAYESNGTTIYRYGQPSEFRIYVSIILSMGTMLLASHYWSDNIEPVFGKISKRAEALMFDQGVGDKSILTGSKPMLPVHKD